MAYSARFGCHQGRSDETIRKAGVPGPPSSNSVVACGRRMAYVSSSECPSLGRPDLTAILPGNLAITPQRRICASSLNFYHSLEKTRSTSLSSSKSPVSPRSVVALSMACDRAAVIGGEIVGRVSRQSADRCRIVPLLSQARSTRETFNQFRWNASARGLCRVQSQCRLWLPRVRRPFCGANWLERGRGSALSLPSSPP